MALIDCPECGKQVSDKAEACPNCGYGIVKKPVPESETEKDTESKKKDGMGCFGVGCLTIVVLFAIIMIFGSLAGGGSSGKTAPDRITACVMCQQFVEKRLKAPSTADFGHCASENCTQEDSVTFEISNYVDAQNSFGAKIRTNFVCRVRYQGNDNWSLVSLSGL